MSATMTLKEIGEAISNGYDVKCYGNKATGEIFEISFSKKVLDKRGKIIENGGFSYDQGCGLRQREFKSLFRRIKKVKPEFEME